MSQAIERLLSNGEDAQRHFRDRGAVLDEKMATWAMLANGAGLLICFNGALDHKICNWSAIAPVAHLFFLGLISAYAKVVFAQRVANDAEKMMIFATFASRTAASLIDAKRMALEVGAENELSKQYDAAIAQIDELRKPKPLMKALELGSNWVLAISVLCFGGVVYWAIVGGLVPAVLCAAR